MNNTVKVNKNGVLMIAHRGVSGLESENTNAAFIAAANRSYYGIETDVHKTADGRFVLMHDGDTLRTTGESMKIALTDYDTLRSLKIKPKEGRAPRNDLIIPSLEEYIDICKAYGKTAVLELKDEFSAQDLNEIYNIISSMGYADKTVFISFIFGNLLHIKGINKGQAAQFLTAFPLDDELIEKLAENGIELDTDKNFCTQEVVNKCHLKGVKVNVWSVDTIEEAERLIEMGVDFITTNILE